MNIKTKTETFENIVKVGYMNVSTTEYERIVPCFICKVSNGYRKIPQEDVVAIQLENCEWFERVRK